MWSKYDKGDWLMFYTGDEGYFFGGLRTILPLTKQNSFFNSSPPNNPILNKSNEIMTCHYDYNVK